MSENSEKKEIEKEFLKHISKDLKELNCYLSKALINAIKKQIPETPYYGNSYDNNGEIIYDTYECPNCHKSYDVNYDGQYNYCPRCGQELDWRMEDY